MRGPNFLLFRRNLSLSTKAMNTIKETVILSACRTPIGSFRSSLASLSAPDLASITIKATLDRANVPASAVQEVFLGNVCQANIGQAPARQASLRAGLDTSTAVTTVNKVCSSGLKAVMLAVQQCQLNHQQVVIGGGMESMSQVPFYVPREKSLKSANLQLSDISLFELNKVTWIFPDTNRNVTLYSFPTLNKAMFEMPTISGVIEKVEPLTDIIPIIDPGKKAPILLHGRRKIKIREKMMKKYKKTVRIRRNWTKLQKVHMEKKAKLERLFRARMALHLSELETFDPMEYIKSTIQTAKTEWSTDLAPSGRKKHPHWSQLITIEEVYKLEQTDPPNYIDKRSCIPEPKHLEELKRLREEYKKYVVKTPSNESVNLKNN